MIHISKKLLVALCLISPLLIIAKKTKKLELIVSPSDPSYFFALNAGSGIETNPGVLRPQGAYYLTNAFIFPGGTVDKNQASYLVDKHGNPLDFENDSLGMAFFIETMLQAVDFSNLPEEGTVIEASQMQLQFKQRCDGGSNAIFATGMVKLGDFSIGQGKSAFNFFMSINSGLGCNENDNPTTFTAKIYISQNGESSLIKIKFDKEIKYRD